MNVKVTQMIREACESARRNGLRLAWGGAWFEWEENEIVATDPIGAVILHQQALPKGLDPQDPQTMVRPGLVGAACRILDVDLFWLYRFWMGYDRNYQIFFLDEDNKPSHKDEVSAFGMTLRRELFR